MMNTTFLALLSLIFLMLFFIAVQRCKTGKFYTDTFALIPFGVFVWGDALILAPFWAVVTLGLSILPPINLLRFLLVFWIFRAGYEVIYWIGNQYAKSDYIAPMFRKIKWIKSNDSAILYQVMNMCIAVASTFLLLLTFQQ